MGRPFKFRVKSGQVVKGWDDGISQLSLGEKARITIPAGQGLCCSVRRLGGWGAAGSQRRVRSGWQPAPQRLQPWAVHLTRRCSVSVCASQTWPTEIAEYPA